MPAVLVMSSWAWRLRAGSVSVIVRVILQKEAAVSGGALRR
jgi:hypothetical protein